MAYIFLSNNNSDATKVRITSFVFQEDLLSEDLKSQGIQISSELIPKVEEKFGKESFFLYNKSNGEVSIEYTERPLFLEEKVSLVLDSAKTASEKYEITDKNGTDLVDLKSAKILALKEQCSETIYAGFTSGDNKFGFNETDQANFTQRMLTIVAGAEGPFEWKSINNGVVELTKDEFVQVIQDAEAHKLVQQKKYWKLEAQVLAAETNEEVDAIKW